MTVTIDLSEQIYPQHCVQSACETFSPLADIELFPQSRGLVSVRISTADSETSIAHEFLNYLLILSIEQFLNDKIPAA
ncbi:MAG TPA: HxsD-like protein [Pyrinomonadaceae bacterium]|nr:HxsD-like protein [Pyrinomonadaceae bacterium]